MLPRSASFFQLAVVVSALGFFVDVYDLLLFGIVRKPSLHDLGLSPEEIFIQGEIIISVQMMGLLAGGILWGILGDKKGRLKVLFGSILLYSIANILNGMVTTIPQYVLLRFIAGVGLAGELGAGITLVSELLPKEKRGIAAAMIASFGILGAVTAFLLSRIVDWRMCYYIGGGLGLLLLMLRLSVYESSLYAQLRQTEVDRGNFLMFFNNRDRFVRYIRCILIGLPAWFIIGVLVTFSDQFGKELGIPVIDPGRAIMYLYLAIAFGDLSVGLLSQHLKSRKKALYIILHDRDDFHCAVFFAKWRQFINILHYLRRVGLRNWFHCCLYNHECRAIRHQSQGFCRHQHSQHGARCFTPDHTSLQIHA
jgi:putative MFS transporter